MADQGFKLLLHGIDTVQCAYYLAAGESGRINFEQLGVERERIRGSKKREPVIVQLGNSEFLLQGYGTSSGYPFVITNENFKIEMGQVNWPNFFVTFRSQALWRDSAVELHQKFMKWATSVGYVKERSERLSRVDFCFDYYLPEIDFDEDCFVSRSTKDSQYRENGRVQTFCLGKRDVVLRVYDKVAEIKQESGKAWFYLLWEMDKDVWRIEWQVRKEVLRQFGIVTFEDLEQIQGDLLRYLAQEHDSLRVKSEDANRSRWPLHPLWEDLLSNIYNINHLGICRVYGQAAALEALLIQLSVIVYGYFKKFGALYSVRNRSNMMTLDETLRHLREMLREVHEPLTWKLDVERRIKEFRLGQW
jgi:hypothetical protein